VRLCTSSRCSKGHKGVHGKYYVHAQLNLAQWSVRSKFQVTFVWTYQSKSWVPNPSPGSILQRQRENLFAVGEVCCQEKKFYGTSAARTHLPVSPASHSLLAHPSPPTLRIIPRERRRSGELDLRVNRAFFPTNSRARSPTNGERYAMAMATRGGLLLLWASAVCSVASGTSKGRQTISRGTVVGGRLSLSLCFLLRRRSHLR